MGRLRRWFKKIFGSDSDYLPGRIRQWCEEALESDSKFLSGEICGDLRGNEADLKLLQKERAYIKKWIERPAKKGGDGVVKKSSDKNVTGIALSGGGIRSATFSLGVLQALARHDVLQYFDYVSTVSGGGYIGLGLTWWLAGKSGSKDKYGVDSKTFPYGIEDPARPAGTQTPILTHLRDNASYLVPGGGISYLSGLVVVMRAVFLNILVWIPLAAALFVLLLIIGTVLSTALANSPLGLESIPNPLAALVTPPKYIHAFDRWCLTHDFFYLLIWVGLAAIAWYAVACIEFAFFTRLSYYMDDSTQGRQRRVVEKEFSNDYVKSGTTRWTVVAILLAMAVAVLAVGFLARAMLDQLSRDRTYLVLLSILLTLVGIPAVLFISWFFRRIWRVRHLGFVYGSRRLFERLFALVMLVGSICFAIGSVPLFVTLANSNATTTTMFGTTGVIVGSAIGVWGHLRLMREKLGPWGSQVVLPLGSVLLFFGIAIMSFQLAIYWLQSDGWMWAGILAIFIIAGLSGFLTNINEISPHLYYRDRLMEAFLPDIERVKDGCPGAARRAERLLLAVAWDRKKPRGPYPIINTNVILVNSPTFKYRLRGGDSFALTPLYCGSNATGWGSTKKFADRKLTLATAMAISGAAVSPNTGIGGKGLARNRFVSAVMTLLNLRLGFWVRRPRKKRVVNRRPDHFHPGLSFCIPGWGYKEGRNFLELSDGGHFENLGLYELVRRGCRLIIVCDGGQDIRASYSDFVAAIRRIEQDFGAEIKFEPKGGPERMIARPRTDEYPKDADYAEHGFLWATIKYNRHAARGGPKEGRIVYLKTTLIPSLSVKAKGYKGAEPSFPEQTTIDQFFDEEQFEAYREVGYRIAETMLNDTALKLKQNLRRIKGSTKAQAWLPSVSLFWPP